MSSMGKLRYAKYYPFDLINGEGARCVLFVSGCSHGCDGCHNSTTWNPNSGEPVTEDLVQRILRDLADLDGFTISGGDPLMLRNRDGVTELCRRIKEVYPDKDIWLWTGYQFEEICMLEVMNYVDVLIDGRYVKNKPTLKPWRGSDNQRMFRRVSGSRQASAFDLLP